MTNLITWLQGKKTYIAAILGALTVFAFWAGLISSSVEQQILTVLGFTAAATLGAKVDRAAAAFRASQGR